MKLMIIVDCQNDFIDGALGTLEAQAMIPRLVQKIKAESSNTQYIITRDTHTRDYITTDEGRLLPVPHCIIGTDGWFLPDDLCEAIPHLHFVDKDHFGSVELCKENLDYVENAARLAPKIEEIEFVGLCTDICVVSNALMLKAYLPIDSGITVSVDSSCCAGTTPEAHEAALTVMKSCQIVVR